MQYCIFLQYHVPCCLAEELLAAGPL
uniref:Uncharacterized protein n=1 Tax=Anguilla anguilla TaxID=7936 RepID=A0A0E9XQN9_ANGAN